MKKITIAHNSQIEVMKRMPSALFRSALYRSGAGVHADNQKGYSKRDRARNRQEERLARQHLD